MGYRYSETRVLHVDDLASAVKLALEVPLPDTLYNVGFGKDISIKELAELIRGIVGYSGTIIWDSSRPNGTLKKHLDCRKIQADLQWIPKIKLTQGILKTCKYFDNQIL